MTTRTSQHLAGMSWTWETNANGNWSHDTIKTATLCAIYQELVTLNSQLRSLGSDGIHQLIRAGLTEVRAVKKKRLARERKKK